MAKAEQKKPFGDAPGRPNILIIWGDDVYRNSILRCVEAVRESPFS